MSKDKVYGDTPHERHRIGTELRTDDNGDYISGLTTMKDHLQDLCITDILDGLFRGTSTTVETRV